MAKVLNLNLKDRNPSESTFEYLVRDQEAEDSSNNALDIQKLVYNFQNKLQH